MLPEKRYAFPSGVAFQRLGEDQDGVMMSLASGFLYRCNRTACVVLEAISNGQSLDEAEGELCRQFGVDAERRGATSRPWSKACASGDW